MMDVKRFLFHSGRSRFTAMLEVTCTVKLGNRDFVSKFAEKIEDNTISDFINKLSVKIISVFCIKQVLQFKVYQQV